jgi:hypothetical protein
VSLDANRIVGLLAEPTRRRVVASLVLQAGTFEDVVRRSGLTLREVVVAVHRLEAGGLVERSADGTLVVLEAAFEQAARSAPPAPRPTDHAGDPPQTRAVLDRYLRNGRLVEIPRRRAARLAVLDAVAQRFEPGVRYDEREVNASLAAVHPDTAALRRYLVDERFLDREGGRYWRAGGTVPVEP